MKSFLGVFFSFTLVFFSAADVRAESDLMPLTATPLATPTAMVTQVPVTAPTAKPQIAVIASPTPQPAISPLPVATPLVSTSPASSPLPWPTPSYSSTYLPAAPVLRPMTIPFPVPSPSVVAPTPATSPAVTSTPAPAPSVVSHPKSAQLLPPITISLFGGGDFISLSEVNQLVGTSLFKTSLYYGGEIRYPFSNEFSVLLRAERISSSSSVGAAAFSLSSLPMMAGIDFHSYHQRKLRVHFSALVGPALNTTLTETASSLPSPNVTQFSSSAISEMLRVSLEYPLGHTVGIFGEGGYRFLKTSSVAPSQTGSGGTIFQSNGQYQAVPLNLSGPFIGGGFVFVL